MHAECADSIEAVKRLNEESIDLILSDIPYGIGADDWDVLHRNTNSAYRGNSPAQSKAGALFKNRGKPINGWSEADRAIPREYYEWCMTWAPSWLRALKPGGSAIIFAGRRLSHRCIAAMEDSGFSYKDMLAWERARAPHRAQRLSVVYERRGNSEAAKQWAGWRIGNLRPTFEPIVWFTKPYKIGTTIADNILNHSVGAFNQDAYSKYSERVENVLRETFAPKESGLHPTQKPVKLMQALIELTTVEGQIVLDPFCGSGSTLLAANYLNRHCIGYDISPEYIEICNRRLRAGLF
ncbi:MAG TPA: site-specific DNA-methyltransferase [Chromatiaceae bacterium]|jgi:site-specific DNA-methyltransferase (adenine-specific)|nr:MAG: site-specific DNA-methyltransferase [Thiohalocapsa sp. PB-PSB1]HBG97102.1 site-specific DNA-methyltransferase [Chromatiaceae bacterium]HCS90126.1 site-specific DNA-methyltransferase [Chromatiaceae bacterium]